MVYQLAALIIIPIILAIVTISPFEGPIKVEPSEPVSEEPQNGMQVFFFIMLVFWTFLLIRTLYHLKKGTFKRRTKL